MKKLLAVAIALLLVITSVPGPARADVIWEPYGDRFYEAHRKEMEHINMSFIVNGPAEGLNMYAAPDDPTIVGTLKNGDVISGEYSYYDNDGNGWILGFGGDAEGWVSRDCLYRQYDSYMFMEQYADSLSSNYVRIDAEYEFPEDGEVQLVYWAYPGAQSAYKGMTVSGGEYLPECDTTFTDEDGLVWGHIGYFCGARNFWICLSNPSAEPADIYGDMFRVRDLRYIEPYTGTPAAPETSGPNNNLIPVIAAVVGIAAIGAALLVILGRRKKENDNTAAAAAPDEAVQHGDGGNNGD